MVVTAFVPSAPDVRSRYRRDVSCPMRVKDVSYKAVKFVADSVKYATLGTAASVLIIRHDVPTVVFLFGAILNAAFGKTLKRLLNQNRPDDSARSDPGMPSSHAMSLCFLSTHIAMDLWTSSYNGPAKALALTGFAATTSASRVIVGYHSWLQVLVGAGFGTVDAVFWHKVFTDTIVPSMQELATREQLKIATALLLALGAIVFFKSDEGK